MTSHEKYEEQHVGHKDAYLYESRGKAEAMYVFIIEI